MSAPPAEEYIVVVGASAGGLEAIGGLLRGLPADFPAAILIVMHIGATSHLAHILTRHSKLPVARAVNGQDLDAGRVFVAVPERHLLVHDSHMLLRRGPRENQARPAIDPLFRSAAVARGSRVIGVVLSGSLSDGSAGLRAIKRCGGRTIVQDPAEAAVPDMPQNALRVADIDHVSSAAGIGALLSDMVLQPARPMPDIPLDIRIEAAIAFQEAGEMKMNTTSDLGRLSPFTCPECHGALWEIEDGPLVRYRCHVGHAYTAEEMEAAQSNEVQTLLDTLLRSNKERAALVWRMAEHEHREQRHRLADQLEKRAREYEENVHLVRNMMLAAEADAVTNDPPGSKVPSDGEEESQA